MFQINRILSSTDFFQAQLYDTVAASDITGILSITAPSLLLFQTDGEINREFLESQLYHIEDTNVLF